jgi:iron complex transport system permease protein
MALALLALSFPLLRRWMPVLELDDGTAKALGVPVTAARLAVVTLAAALAAVAVAVAGPISFLGLVAAPVARGITGRPGFSAAGSGLAGALIVLVADLIGAHAFGELAVPVGVVAAAVGAPYLMFLLARSGRAGSGGMR